MSGTCDPHKNGAFFLDLQMWSRNKEAIAIVPAVGFPGQSAEAVTGYIVNVAGI